MSIEDNLISAFYIGFFMYLVFSVLLILILFILAFFMAKIMRGNTTIGGNNAFNSKIIIAFLFVSICLLSIFNFYKFSTYCKDLKNVQQRSFETITAIAVGYSSVGEGNGPNDLSYGTPIFEVPETGEKIKLSVGPVELNETYTLIYLKHCKLAEIIKHN